LVESALHGVKRLIVFLLVFRLKEQFDLLRKALINWRFLPQFFVNFVLNRCLAAALGLTRLILPADGTLALVDAVQKVDERNTRHKNLTLGMRPTSLHLLG
jgi:hypothetical protein